MPTKQRVPFLVLKKGICKHNDAERIKRASGKNIGNLLDLICDDWMIPHISWKWVNQPCGKYYGQYEVRTFRGVTTHLIILNSAVTFFNVWDSTTPIFKRERLMETIIHEMAHYIDVMMNGYSSHGPKFQEIFRTLLAANYQNKLEEVE